jgi:hypothetical protein
VNPFLAHQARDRRQRVEVRDAAVLRRQQPEHQIDRQTVGGCELDRFGELDQHRHRTLEARNTRVRYRHAATEAGAAEPFSILDPFEHRRGVELIDLREALGEERENGGLAGNLGDDDRFGT